MKVFCKGLSDEMKITGAGDKGRNKKRRKKRAGQPEAARIERAMRLKFSSQPFPTPPVIDLFVVHNPSLHSCLNLSISSWLSHSSG